METLKSFCKKHIISIIGGAIVLLIIAFTSIQSGCEISQFNGTISNQTVQANKAVQQAANAQNAAVNASIERRSEDAVREKIIAPKLDAARRQSQTSKTELDKAEKEFQNAKKNTNNLNRTIADNCAELSRLYPDIEFEYCSGR